jgi:large subunit ribosomal protein L9
MPMAKELILIEDVPGLGIEGDVVKVAEGYARNFLLPKNLAVLTTAMSTRQVEAHHAAREERLRSERERAEVLVMNLETTSVTIPVKAGEGGKLFGSVQSSDIAAALKVQGFEIDRHLIQLKKALRELGVYEVVVKPHPEFQATVKVWVVEE